MSSIPKGTSLYAAYRADLAYDRLEYWRAEAQRFEDRADTRRSKSARTREMNLARTAERNADRAAIEYQKWQHRAETLAAREELEARRRRRPIRVPPKKKAPPKKKVAKKKKKPKKTTVIPPIKRKRFEYLLKVSYEAGRRGASARAHNVWWDVRFRKRDGSRATQAELEYAVRRLHLGEIPNGWDVLSIAWDRGNRSAGSVPDREASTGNELLNAMASLGATMDSRGGLAWEDHRGEYVGANYTIGEEELDAN
jgi:hypothetical protein